MHKALLLLAMLSLLHGAGAQVRTSAEAFPLPVAAAPMLPVRPYVPPAAAAAPAAAPAPAELPTAPQLVIRGGRSVGEELRAFAKPAGWDLVWEAGPYVAERDVVLAGGFETAMETFLQGANEAGSRIRAVFYRGSRTVRIWED
ncbi:MAG TPA: TcpQ domain-containing protein [Ramlibacter sp.]|jgi:hypothetical protein|nr:TcpQ domain-containing protein [Ramlibacter sp.]